MENQDGKRVARGPGMPRGGKIALAVVLVLVLALAGGYVGLCAYAGSSAFLPNTSIAGVDVSGQSREGATAALGGALPGLLADSRAEFTCAGQSYAVNGDDPSVSVDAAAAVDAALTDQAGSFFTRGGRYLAAVMHGNRYSVPVTLTGTPDAVTRAVEECSDPEAQTTWEVTDTELVLHKGVTGRTIDVAALTDALAERLGHLVSNDEPASYAPIEAQVTTAPPAAPDFDAIRSEVAAEPADAYLDKETREIVPSVTGVDFDTAQAQAVLDAAGEGETVSVPLLLTEPKLTTAKLEANLFKDVLGSGSTTCAGPSNRWYNIDLAAKRLNGTILLPGETFSYNDTVGPYTLASGYKAAGTYQNGQSVDATAGGICQLSSNLYWVTLKANLEIVERHKHQFNGGYMPVIGTDATVWSDQLDFRFQNNTDYPIKIESYLDKNHKLHVTIYGTDTTGIHGEPYHVVISTVPYKNTYQPKDSIPVGTEPQRDPNYSRYNGYTVDLYQKLVDKNGKTISTTLLYRNTYKASDAVYYYNPADAARWAYFPGIIDIRLQKRAFHSRFDRFIKQFKVCQNQLNGCMSPQVQRREKGKNPFCGAESKTSILQLKGSIRIVISPADIQKIIGTDDNIPGAVQAIQFLLRTEPDTPFVILQQAVDGIGNQIVIYGIGMRLFPIRPNTYKAFPVCSQPGIAG